ncbi:MAG: DUF1549 domain-containing protein [Planctomycetaceae bacterium]
MPKPRTQFLLVMVAAFVGQSGETAGADRPSFYQQIDQLVADARTDSQEQVAERSSDAEFFRRIHLDLVGSIPSAAETRTFLEDPSPTDEKRERMIDRLLADPRYGRRMQYVFDEIIMERRPGANVSDEEWQQYLRESFQQNQPWDTLVREILSADGVAAELRPAARFYLDRNLELDVVTRDIGRVFLGVDLECAQCHDHPFVEDYEQRHYYGINAFLTRTYLFTEPKSKQKQLGEKAEGDVTFTSVFTNEEGETDPRMLDLAPIPDPVESAKQYVVEPKKGARGVPSYSRRQALARIMVSNENRSFHCNIVNRLWALMMGRGLVEPLDCWHSENPPSHPDIVDLLAREFVDHNHDVRWLLKQLALTETYQRSSRVETSRLGGDVPQYAAGLLKPLSPEQLAWSVMQATGVVDQTLAARTAEFQEKHAASTSGNEKGDEISADESAVDTTDDEANDPVWREQTLRLALKPMIDQFVKRFAASNGQTTGFDSNAQQALFLMNSTLIQDWLVPNRGNLLDRLSNAESAAPFAEELYHSVLNRPPSETEIAEVSVYLAAQLDRTIAAQDLTWALLTSAEFRFNH